MRARFGTGLSVTLALLAIAACGVADPDRLATNARTCLGSTDPAGLSNLFAAEPGGVIGADYQRGVELPDGRTLWLFQDATIRLPPPPVSAVTTTTIPGRTPDPPPPTERLLHNIGMIQSGNCFDVLRTGTVQDPGPWLLANETVPFSRWFWPLDAEMANDGKLYIHMAAMAERGGLYLSATEPLGTRVVAIDPNTLAVGGSTTPESSSRSLYGFSIASDATWTYLYGHCHRQFGWNTGPFGVPAHDAACAPNVPVARVPKGQLLNTPSYWDGSAWQADPNRAVAVIPTTGRRVNPTQVRYDAQLSGGRFVAVTKVDDWFGSTIYLDQAPAAQGPWTNYARLPATPKCSPLVCNTYFASWVPGTIDGDYVIGLSHNRWDGVMSTINRPSFLTAPKPGSHSLALRCAIVDC